MHFSFNVGKQTYIEPSKRDKVQIKGCCLASFDPSLIKTSPHEMMVMERGNADGKIGHSTDDKLFKWTHLSYLLSLFPPPEQRPAMPVYTRWNDIHFMGN